MRKKTHGVDNPFLISGYISPEFFCDRERETGDLMEAIENGRNVTLLSPRRMGKTGLIHHLFHHLEKEGKWTPIYIDIFAASDLSEFVRRFAAAVIGTMDTRMDKAVAAAGRFFRSFRPLVSIDPATGAPSYSFSLEPAQLDATLKECFEYLKAKGRHAVVAFDEFQQVAEFPEKGTEALLRSHIQFMPNTRFIFAGSKRHMISEMFSAPNRPFFNSTQTMPIGTIDRGKYYEFAKRHFQAIDVQLGKEVFDKAYDMFGGVTWNVQAVMNRLYARRSADASDLLPTIDRLVSDNAYYYETILDGLPLGSVRLLKAIAAEGHVEEPTSGAFIAKHGLRASASVRLSLSKLCNLGLVSRENGAYIVEDRLFGIWLSRLP